MTNFRRNVATDALNAILTTIPVDWAGGCPFHKAVWMLNAMLENGCKRVIEIGVWRGRSLMALALAMSLVNGKAFGIDPYNKAEGHEDDLCRELDVENELSEWLTTTDFDAVHQSVLDVLEREHLSTFCQIIRMPAASAVQCFDFSTEKIDFLHIDGNHDTVKVLQDIHNYCPHVSARGIVVMDDVCMQCVQRALPALEKLGFEEVENHSTWSVWRRQAEKQRNNDTSS